jgi:hypothetical protein
MDTIRGSFGVFVAVRGMFRTLYEVSVVSGNSINIKEKEMRRATFLTFNHFKIDSNITALHGKLMTKYL